MKEARVPEALLFTGKGVQSVNHLISLCLHTSESLSPLQKELGQKDRLLQQQQAKLEEAVRKLSDASYQQVRMQQPLACLTP